MSTKALHSKPKVFFTSSPNSGSLACEVVSFRYRSISLVKRSACAAREVAACRRVDVFLFTALRLNGGVAALIFSFAVIYYFTEGDHLMAESKLRTLSIDFSVQILNLVKFLKSQHETIVSNQIGRAGTSIGAKNMKPSGFASCTAGALHGTQCRFILLCA